MADFNLSAEIQLQLAANTVTNLKKDIQKGFAAPFEVTDLDQAEKMVKKTKKKIEDPIVVPVTFDPREITTEYTKLRGKLKPIPLEVAFSQKSVDKNLTSRKLQAMLGETKLIVPVDVQFSKNTQRELKKVEAQLLKLSEYKEKLEKSVNENFIGPRNQNAANMQIVNPDQALKDIDVVSREFDDLIKRINRLAFSQRTTFGGSASFGGGFFQFGEDQIKGLVKELDRLSDGKGLDVLKKKFEGLSDGGSINNFLNSLRTLFRELTNLDALEKRLTLSAKSVPGQSFAKELQAITDARADIGRKFLSVESADPQSFATSVKATYNVAQQAASAAITAITRDVKDYDRLMTSIRQKEASARAGGAGSGRLTQIAGLISQVETLRRKGSTTGDIRSSSVIQNLQGIVGALQYIDIAASRATSAIDAMQSQISKAELKGSFGGLAVDLANKSQAIGAKAATTIAGLTSGNDPNASKLIEKAKSDAKQEVAILQQRAEKINGLFGRLTSQIVKFEADGFAVAANNLRAFIPELARLGGQGRTIQDLAYLVDKKLAESFKFKGIDSRVNTVIKQIERLRNTLEFSAVDDVIGAKKKLDDLQLKIENGLKTGSLGQKSLDKEASKGIFDVRAAQRFNDAVANGAIKLRNLGDANDNLAVGEKYYKWANGFEKAAQDIGASSDALGVKILKLKQLFDTTLIKARVDAEGGFLGTVAKAAGLAAKRLGSFLILAQGLYGIQSLITTAVQDSIKIDREFVKLEQVLNKDFTGDKLKKNLSSLQAQILTLGKSLGVSTLEVANAAQILAQAGVSGSNLEKLLGTVAKSQLGPSFGSATETAEAAIAVFRQFNLTAEQTQVALGGINQLSARYAVEAQGITEAVRRAGGVFATSGDDIASFASAFTIIKQQTREADESIATALRNVAQRLQSTRVQDYLKQTLGINLTEGGEFVGFEKSIQRIGIAIKKAGISERSPLFSQIREQIAGRLQAGRITPLLQDYEQFEDLVKSFGEGASSIDKDVETAFGSIENKLQRARGAVVELFNEIISSDFAKFLVESFTQITNFATGLLRALNSIPGAILAIGAAAKLLGSGKLIAQTALSQVIGRTTLFGGKDTVLSRNTGGDTGYIPGRGPNKDTLLAYLTKGEYVIQRDAVDKYGVNFLDMINNGTFTANKGGIARRNKGGLIGFNDGGELTKRLILAGFNVTRDLVDKFVKSFKIANFADPNKIGSANTRNKSIQVAPNTDLATLAHEFGHIITSTMDQSKLLTLLDALPAKFKNAVLNRMKLAPSIYGKEGSEKFNSKINRELAADAVALIASKNSIANDPAFKALADAITQDTGVKFADKVVRPLTEPSALPRKTARAVGAGVRPLTEPGSKAPNWFFDSMRALFGKFTTRSSNRKMDPSRPLTGERDHWWFDPEKALADEEKKSAIFRGVRTSNRQMQPDRRLSGDSDISRGSSVSVGSNKPLARASGYRFEPIVGSEVDRSNDPRFFARSELPQRGPRTAAIVKTAGVSGGISAFLKSLTSTKAGLITLGTTVLGTVGIMGQFNQGLADLVMAMVAGAATMYATTRTGDLVSSLKATLGGPAKLDMIKGMGGFKGGAGLGKSATAKFISESVKGGGLSKADAIKGAADLVAEKRARAAAAGLGKNVFKPGVDDAKILGGGSLIGKGLGKLGTSMPTFAKAGTALAKGLGPASIAIGAVTAALGFFVSKAEEGAAQELASANTLEQALAAGSKKRFAESIKGPINNIGGILGKALTGAAIGTAIAPGIGTIIGALVGGLSHFAGSILDALKNIPALKGIANIAKSVSDGAKSVFNTISDKMYAISKDIQVGDLRSAAKALLQSNPVTFGVGGLIKDDPNSEGQKRLKLAKEDDARTFRIASLTRGFGSNKNQKTIGASDIADLGTNLKFAQELLRDGRNAVKGGNGTFADLGDEAQTEIKNNVSQVVEAFKAAGPKNKEVILQSFESMGLDLFTIAKDVGVELSRTEKVATAAFDKLTIFFAQMEKMVELNSARLTGLEGGLDFFKSGNNKQLAPNQLFDIIQQGIDPSTLGFGDVFNKAFNNSKALVNQFDPRLARAADLEARGKIASRNTSSAILQSGATLKDREAGTIETFLQDSFAKATGGDRVLGSIFEKFVGDNADKVSGLVNQDGNIDAGAINDLFKEFSTSLESGAFEQIKRINELSKNFADQYKQQLAERFALENEAIGFAQTNADLQKSVYDIQNRARGLTGSSLLRAQTNQGRSLDSNRLGLALSGTGLGGNASVAEMRASLLASQQRSRNAGNIAAQSGATGFALVERTSQIEAAEAERQNRLKAGLAVAAGETEHFTNTMKAFDQAMQKASESSKFMTDALLGTDDQLAQSMKGIVAFGAVQKAFKDRGVQGAREVVMGLSEESRAALQSNLSSNSSNQELFQRYTGIAPNIAAGPEAAAAQGAIKRRQEANDALAAGITDQIGPLIQNTESMKALFEMQFANTRAILAQADATAKALVGQIAALPSTIQHEANINVNIIGAGELKTLEKGINDMVQAKISAALNDFGNKLVANNQGLNRP